MRCTDINLNAELRQNMMKHNLDEFLPIKVLKLSSDDKPLINHQLKILYRKCEREFFTHHKSEKWTTLRQTFEEKCEKAKEDQHSSRPKGVQPKSMVLKSQKDGGSS